MLNAEKNQNIGLSESVIQSESISSTKFIKTVRTRSKLKKRKLDIQKQKLTKINETLNFVTTDPPTDDPSKRRKWIVHKRSKNDIVIPNPKQIAKESGILITDYIIGSGIEPRPGSIVKICYEGLFPSDIIFDSKMSMDDPLCFRTGLGQVVRGLDLGLEGMAVGGFREIVVPAALA